MVIHTSIMPIIQMGNGGPGKDQALPKVLMPELGLELRPLASEPSPLSSASSEVVLGIVFGGGCS